jgi:hypothetical protein
MLLFYLTAEASLGLAGPAEILVLRVREVSRGQALAPSTNVSQQHARVVGVGWAMARDFKHPTGITKPMEKGADIQQGSPVQAKEWRQKSAWWTSVLV